MSEAERIERLEYVLGTLINWLHGTISTDEGQVLLKALESVDPKFTLYEWRKQRG